jgi:hypothetical protein
VWVYSVVDIVLRCYPLSSPRVFPEHRRKALTTPRQRQAVSLSSPLSPTLPLVTLLMGRDRLTLMRCVTARQFVPMMFRNCVIIVINLMLTKLLHTIARTRVRTYTHTHIISKRKKHLHFCSGLRVELVTGLYCSILLQLCVS